MTKKKNPEENKYRKTPLEYDKSYLWKTTTENHIKWKDTKSSMPKIKTKQGYPLSPPVN